MQDDDKINTQNAGQVGESSLELDKNIQEEVSKLEKQYGLDNAERANKSAGVPSIQEESSIVKKINELEKESGIVDTEIKTKEEEVKNRLAEIQSEIKRLNELKTIGQKITEKKSRLKELDEMEKKIKEETDSLKKEAEDRLSQKAGTKITGVVPIIFAVIFGLSQIFLFAPKVSAQLGQYDISISSSPSNPGPNEGATISVFSLTEDLSDDVILWSVDGKEVANEIGKNSISITTKGVGEALSISAKIHLSGGGINEQKMIIFPAGVDIFWEGADSYAPPFYKGRVLPSTEAMIRVVAMPFTSKDGVSSMGASGFTYKWSRNLGPIPSASGYGRNSLTFRSSLLEEREGISVSATSSSSSVPATGLATIIPGRPFIRFYEKDSDLGTKYEEALSTLDISGRIANIIAEPFFFSVKDPADKDITYTWKINEAVTNPQKNKNELSIAPGKETGSASVSLNIESRSKLFQSSKARLTVFLNKQ